MPGTTEGDVIPVGSVYTNVLPDGRYGAVRVEAASDSGGEVQTLLAITPYLDYEAPGINEPRLLETLIQRRGRFRNAPALIWVDGEPTREFEFIGVIGEATTNDAHRASAVYGGMWSAAVTMPVLWEAQFTAGVELSHAPSNSGESRRVTEQEAAESRWSDEEFWQVIRLIDVSSLDTSVAVEHLIQKSEPQIQAFLDLLAAKLHRLDRVDLARETGSSSFGSPEGFSPDGFLYARCAVVARGQDLYEAVLNDPRLMPKDEEFEALLYLAQEAIRRKTGDRRPLIPAVDFETFANLEGWSDVPEVE